MNIRYSPCQCDGRDTVIAVIDDNSLTIDGEWHEFDPNSVAWPKIAEESRGAIVEAHRDSNSILFLTIKRLYSNSCTAWDDGLYHEVTPCWKGGAGSGKSVGAMHTGKTQEDLDAEAAAAATAAAKADLQAQLTALMPSVITALISQQGSGAVLKTSQASMAESTDADQISQWQDLSDQLAALG